MRDSVCTVNLILFFQISRQLRDHGSGKFSDDAKAVVVASLTV
jgi:hypothetical protein